jgi:hypothetical protein
MVPASGLQARGFHFWLLGLVGLFALAGVQANQYPRVLDIGRPVHRSRLNCLKRDGCDSFGI